MHAHYVIIELAHIILIIWSRQIWIDRAL